jgi:uncharacterized OsmC-like protein
VVARVNERGIGTGVANGSHIDFDASRGRSDEVPGPAELLALSLGACILKNVERFSHLLSFAYDGAAVTVEAERQDDPPRFTKITYELRVRTNEGPHRVELLHKNVRRFGTVYNTLAASCEVEGTIVAGPDVTKAFQTATPDPFAGDVCC